MKLTIEVTLQDKSFDKMRAKITVEQPNLGYVNIGQAVDAAAASLVNKALYTQSFTPEENEQLGLPLD
jgi:hypothetical protein